MQIFLFPHEYHIPLTWFKSESYCAKSVCSLFKEIHVHFSASTGYLSSPLLFINSIHIQIELPDGTILHPKNISHLLSKHVPKLSCPGCLLGIIWLEPTEALCSWFNLLLRFYDASQTLYDTSIFTYRDIIFGRTRLCLNLLNCWLILLSLLTFCRLWLRLVESNLRSLHFGRWLRFQLLLSLFDRLLRHWVILEGRVVIWKAVNDWSFRVGICVSVTTKQKTTGKRNFTWSRMSSSTIASLVCSRSIKSALFPEAGRP